jgi:hypothetical protein
MSRLNKRFLRKASKAPYISIVTIVIILPLLITSSILYTKAATKSMAAFFGRVPPCYRLSNPEVSVVQAIRRAIIFLYPFVIHESRVIGRQDLTEDLFFFPIFDIIITSLSFYKLGK